MNYAFGRSANYGYKSYSSKFGTKFSFKNFSSNFFENSFKNKTTFNAFNSSTNKGSKFFSSLSNKFFMTQVFTLCKTVGSMSSTGLAPKMLSGEINGVCDATQLDGKEGALNVGECINVINEIFLVSFGN